MRSDILAGPQNRAAARACQPVYSVRVCGNNQPTSQPTQKKNARTHSCKTNTKTYFLRARKGVRSVLTVAADGRWSSSKPQMRTTGRPNERGGGVEENCDLFNVYCGRRMPGRCWLVCIFLHQPHGADVKRGKTIDGHQPDAYGLGASVMDDKRRPVTQLMRWYIKPFIVMAFRGW